jgi:hypothetical protein
MILKAILWTPLALAVLAAALWAGPWNRWTMPDEAKARDVIVPLNARDPSALVMGPLPVKCSGPCPTAEQPR